VEKVLASGDHKEKIDMTMMGVCTLFVPF